MMYAGADWLESNFSYIPRLRGKTLSPFARKVADILGQTFAGLYHIPHITRQRWFDPSGGVFVLLTASELATFDGSELTSLVVLCHDAAIRFAVGVGREPWDLKGDENAEALDLYKHVYRRLGAETAIDVCSMRRLELSFHEREHGAEKWHRRHRTMEQSVETFRKAFAATEESAHD